MVGDQMSTICYAKVVTSIPGAGLCRIIGNGFDAWAIFNGQGSTGLGVRESGGLAPGTLVAVRLGVGAYPGVILATFRHPTDPKATNFKPRTLADPQCSGFYPDGLLEPVLTRKTWSVDQFRVDGFMDLVAGEWSKLSPFGAFSNVEFFRAAMGAGPMSGIEFFTDTGAARLRGLDLDVETLSTEDHHRRLWNSLEHTTRDFWTPKEAINSDTVVPRRLQVSGQVHQSSQRFVGGPAPRGTPRPALFQEFVGDDGTAVLTSASAVVLQRVVDLDLPEEVEETDQNTHRDEVAAALGTPRAPIEVTGDLMACTTAQAAWDIIDGVLRFWARNGVDGVPQQWAPGRTAVEPAAPLQSAEMWGRVPRTVEIRLDATGRTKKFYVGRSTFALLPDGSVLVENAGQAQIMLCGPNIILSAPGDIIAVCGGTHQVLAGKSAVIRAQENVQLAANTGRCDIKAERQLSLLGGNDGGAEGVLVESRATGTASVAGTGSAGSIGGIVLKSASGAFIAAESELGLSTKGILTTKAQAVQLDVESISARVVNGLTMFATGSDKPIIQVSVSGASRTLWFNGGTVFDGDIVATGGALINGVVVSGDSVYARNNIMGTSVGEGGTDPATGQTLATQVSKMVESVNRSLTPFETSAKPFRETLETVLNADVPILWTKVDRYGFSFMDTSDYGVVSFGLPETRWQRAARDTGSTWIEKFVKAPSSTDITMPYPGHSAWTSPGAYFRAPDAVFFDPVTSAFTLSQPSDDPGSMIPVATPGELTAFIRSP
jgi:hypothetical protein